jgi:hypothetical protein
VPVVHGSQSVVVRRQDEWAVSPASDAARDPTATAVGGRAGSGGVLVLDTPQACGVVLGPCDTADSWIPRHHFGDAPPVCCVRNSSRYMCAAVAGLPPERFGVGGAVNETARQIGAVLGVALLVAVLGTRAPLPPLSKAFNGRGSSAPPLQWCRRPSPVDTHGSRRPTRGRRSQWRQRPDEHRRHRQARRPPAHGGHPRRSDAAAASRGGEARVARRRSTGRRR